LTFIVGVLFVIVVWYLIAKWFNTYRYVGLAFPDPIDAFNRLWGYLNGSILLRRTIYEHIAASMSHWIVGFALASIVGLLIGIALGSKEEYYQFGIVPINIIQMIPGLAWLPVTILLFGFGENSAVFLIAITCISPIAINVCAGIRRVPPVNLRVARMSKRSRLETLTEVLLPFATIDILNGLRIGMANAWRMLIAAEMVVGVAEGIGYAIDSTTKTIDYPAAFACIIIICVIGLIIDKLIFVNIEKYARRKLGFEETD